MGQGIRISDRGGRWPAGDWKLDSGIGGNFGFFGSKNDDRTRRFQIQGDGRFNDEIGIEDTKLAVAVLPDLMKVGGTVSSQADLDNQKQSRGRHRKDTPVSIAGAGNQKCRSRFDHMDHSNGNHSWSQIGIPRPGRRKRSIVESLDRPPRYRFVGYRGRHDISPYFSSGI